MSEHTGTTISCDGLGSAHDRYGCNSTAFGATPEAARENAEDSRWTRHEDGRDFCAYCTEQRAKRRPLRELVPAGVRLMRVFEACEAVGFERRDYNEETGEAHFWCCGQEVGVDSIIGSPYRVKCSVCGSSVVDVLGPTRPSNSTVAFPDPNKVDTEDPCSWVVEKEFEAAHVGREPEEGL